FGLKAAGWLVSVSDARRRLAGVASGLPAQLGGAGGTLAAFGDIGPELVRLYAVEGGLQEPTVPWPALPNAPPHHAGPPAGAPRALGKIAGDVVLLAQTEVAEVAEAEGGPSSTLPHKQNPTAALLARACARHAQANAALLASLSEHEHERAAGAWHAEWA